MSLPRATHRPIALPIAGFPEANSLLNDNALHTMYLFERDILLKDKSGNNNDATISGATWQSNTLLFDGVNDDAENLSVSISGDFSICIMGRTPTGQAEFSSIFSGSTGGAAADTFQIEVSGGTNLYRLNLTDTGVGTQYITFGTNDGAWHFLVLTNSQSGGNATSTTYFDGAGNTPEVDAYAPSWDAIRLAVNRGESIWLNCNVAFYALYTKVLSANEVMILNNFVRGLV
jgi:hypothetical protein